MAPQTAPCLPSGWNSDYDESTQKWFYIYRPTGKTQQQFPQPGDHLLQKIVAAQRETSLVKEPEPPALLQAQESSEGTDNMADIKQPAPTKPAQQPVRRLSELTRKPIPTSSSPASLHSTQSAQISLPASPQIPSHPDHQPSQGTVEPINRSSQFKTSEASQSQQLSSLALSVDSTPICVEPHNVHTPSMFPSPGQPSPEQSSSGWQQNVHNFPRPQGHQSIGGLHISHPSNPVQASANPSTPSTSTPAQSLHSSHGYSHPSQTPTSNTPRLPQQPFLGDLDTVGTTNRSQNHVQTTNSNHDHPETTYQIIQNQRAPSPHPASFPYMQNLNQKPSQNLAPNISQTSQQSSVHGRMSSQPQIVPQGLEGQKHPSPAAQSIHSSISSQNSNSYIPITMPPVPAVSGSGAQHFGMPPGHPLIHAGIYVVYPKLPFQTQQTYTYQPLGQPPNSTRQEVLPKPPTTHPWGQLNQQACSTGLKNPSTQLSTHPQPNQSVEQGSAQFQGQHFHNSNGSMGNLTTSSVPSEASSSGRLSSHPLYAPDNTRANHLNQQYPVMNKNNILAGQQGTHIGNSTASNHMMSIQGSVIYVSNPPRQISGSTILPHHNKNMQTHPLAQQNHSHVQGSVPVNQPITANQAQVLPAATLQQQQVSQTRIFSAPASLAARASRGDLPSKFAVGASNTANKAVSGAKNFFKGNVGKKVAVSVGGAIVGEALGMTGAQGANLANAVHTQYRNAPENSGQQNTVQTTVVSANGGRLPPAQTIQSINIPCNGAVQGNKHPGAVHSNMRTTDCRSSNRPETANICSPSVTGVTLSDGGPNNVGIAGIQGNEDQARNAPAQANGRRAMNERKPARVAVPSNRPTQLPAQQPLQSLPTYQQHPHSSQDQNDQPCQSNIQTYNQSQARPATSPPLNQGECNPSGVQLSQMEGNQQIILNAASSQWDPVSSSMEQQYFSSLVSPQALFSSSNTQNQQTLDSQPMSLRYELAPNNNNYTNNSVPATGLSYQVQQPLDNQPSTLVDQSIITDKSYVDSFLTTTSSTSQSNAFYVQDQNLEQDQPLDNGESTTIIHQSISSGNTYPSNSFDLATSEQVPVYENTQFSDPPQQGLLYNQFTSAVISGNPSDSAYSSIEVDAQSPSCLQTDSQLLQTTEACYVDHESDAVVVESSAEIQVDVETYSSKFTNEVMENTSGDVSVEASVEETGKYYQVDVNNDYEADGGW